MKIRIISSAGFILLALISFFNLGNYQNMSSGYTAAPGEDDCGSCHTPQVIGMIGGVVLEGLPARIFPNQSYALKVKVYDSDGPVQPENGGFMLTALNASNNLFGTLSNASAFTKLFSSAGRQYATHKTARSFLGVTDIDTVEYTFNWKAPATGETQAVTFYYTAVMGNNIGTPNVINDRAFSEIEAVTFVSPLETGSISISDQINCFGQNSGALTINPSGGLTPYAYSWSNGSHDQTATNLPAGTYTVTVTDAAGQTGTASKTLSQPTILALSINNVHPVSCFGASDGQASALGSGGTPPYTFVWSNGHLGNMLSGVSAGAYTVTATDFNGCSKTQSVSITQPPQLTVNNIQVSNASNGQNNGAIDISVSGGTSGYTYQWLGPFGFTATSQDLTDLEAGVYFVTITDQNGCTAQVNGGITVSMETGVEALLEKNVGIFPNPASHELQVSLLQANTAWQLQMLDITGKVQRSVCDLSPDTVCHLDISGLQDGIYILRITTSKGATLSKLIQVQKN